MPEESYLQQRLPINWTKATCIQLYIPSNISKCHGEPQKPPKVAPFILCHKKCAKLSYFKFMFCEQPLYAFTTIE